MEHIEEAGIHSGDSLVHAAAGHPRPAASSSGSASRPSSWPRGSACAGLMNVQFALAQDILYVLEANPRASRTVPFVAKATGVPLAKAAARIMLGATIAELRGRGDAARRTATAAGCRPTRRCRSRRRCCRSSGSAPARARSSTACSARRCARPARSWASTRDFGRGVRQEPARRDRRAAPTGDGVRVGGQPRQAGDDLPGQAAGRPRLHASSRPRAPRMCCGATGSRPRWCASTPSAAPRGEPTIVDRINAGEVDMVVNTPERAERVGAGRRLRDPRGHDRRMDKPIITTVQQLAAAVQAIEARASPATSGVKSLQDHAPRPRPLRPCGQAGRERERSRQARGRRRPGHR